MKIKCGVLIERRGKLLLIKERNGIDGKYYWNIIKGTFEPDKDKDLFSAAVREAWEEARAKIKIKRLLRVFFLKEAHRVLIQFTFVANLKENSFGIADKISQSQYRKDESIIDARLFSKSELQKLREKDFIGTRAYLAVKYWLKKDFADLKYLENTRSSKHIVGLKKGSE